MRKLYARIIFEEDPLFSGHIRDNLFRGRIELSGSMPWSRSYLDATDKDDIHIRHYIEKNYKFGNGPVWKQTLETKT